ncbi:hypothetical protein GCM10017044_21910 [Kordiimonas sediminis]|uniref:Histidine kinase n=1 Tax=Kordiimonas sediminis TaxID=1735581 RepID=A0A919AUC3_9PROT|nr:ATP-binding protein [Kordiimonas sediminis]GHF26542.1 hypothetical protein GCM10017044_21910 [Kordiimonas sediminis]
MTGQLHIIGQRPNVVVFTYGDANTEERQRFYQSLSCPDYSVSVRKFTQAAETRKDWYESISNNTNFPVCLILDGGSDGHIAQQIIQEVQSSDMLGSVPVILVCTDIPAIDPESELTWLGVKGVVANTLSIPEIRSYIATVTSGLIRESQDAKRSDVLFYPTKIVHESVFRVQTRHHARDLSYAVARTLAGGSSKLAAGLTELLVNGIEHGCLGIDGATKGRLIEEGAFVEEIHKRRMHPEYADKFVELKIWQMEHSLFFEILDQGKGFDSAAVLSTGKVDNKSKHGRGIVIAQGCFADLRYITPGNRVKARYDLT